jgi:uncharacterized protein
VHYISAFYPGSTTVGPSASPVLVERVPPDAADFAIAVSHASTVVSSGSSASTQVIVEPINGFSQGVTLACSTGTPRLACSLQSTTLSGGSGTSKLTISVTETSDSSANSQSLLRLAGLFALPFLFSSLFLRRTDTRWVLSLVVLSCAMTFGCGSPARVAPAKDGRYLVTVTGTSEQVGAAIVHAVSLHVQIVSQ